MSARAPRLRWSFTPFQTALCAIAASLIVTGGWIAFSEAKRAMGSVARVQHTFSVLLKIDALNGAISNLQMGRRGYIASGDSDSLARYEAAVLGLPILTRDLAATVADNPEQQRRVEALIPLIEAKIAATGRSIAQARGAHAAGKIEALRAGASEFEKVRAGIDALRLEENELLAKRLAARDEHLRATATGTLILGVLSFAIFAGVLASLNRTIADRRRAERDALENAERLRVTLESIGDAVIATDVAGAVVYMNPVARALTGWRPEDARGIPLDQVFRIVNEYSREMVESPVSKVMREGGIVGLANHTILIARDGSERPIDDSGAPIRGGDGELMGVVLVFRDVTARRLSEQARERLLRSEAARENAESANQAKDEFLAVVSHELRSPLTAAVSWVELLKTSALGAVDQRRALDTIERNLRHQAVLISDLLDVSRIVTGKLTIEQIPCDVSRLVQEAVDDQSGAAEAKRLALHFERARPLIAVADPDRFKQILSNLLSNAIRFTPPGGRIDVAIATGGAHFELTVRDTGQGIPPNFLPHVFERFRQAEGARVRDHGGLGLGLAIAKYLVEQHGGTIGAESDGEDRGATFRVQIPFRTGEPDAERKDDRSDVSSSSLSDLHILLVEDHVDTRDAVAHRLRSLGAKVSVAASVAEAILHYRVERPSILISDLGLPGESGFTLIRNIRSEEVPLGLHTAAIAVSGFVSGEDRREALAAGFDEHLPKPVDFRNLLDKIEAVRAARAS